jgi:hypothetical protein
MARKERVEVRPCPFCGEGGPEKYDPEEGLSGLHVGHLSAVTYGVRCYACGATMGRPLPNSWGRHKTYEGLCRATIRKVAEAWNKRAPAAREGEET